MFNQNNPSESETDAEILINQPENTSFAARLAYLPGMNYLPGVDEDDSGRTQDLVSLAYPFRHGPAIVGDDGSLIGAVKISPANMSFADTKTWERRVKELADALASTVNYKAQWYNPTRAVNYEARRDRYKDAEDALTRGAADPTRGDLVRASVYEEIAAVVNLYQMTTRTREHYMLVKVEPSEGVLNNTGGEGGLGTVPGVGRILEKKELREKAGSAELVSQLLDTLKRRVNELSTELSQIEGISAHPVSAFDLTQTAADYFRADDIGAWDGFKDALRGGPTPGILEDPEYEMSYGHVTSLESPSQPVAETDGGTQPAQPVHPDELRGPMTPAAGDTSPASTDEPWSFDYSIANDGAVSDLVSGKEDLTERYKTLLAPDEYHRDLYDHVKIVHDEEYFSTTLALRDWPNSPGYGALTNILNYSHPGVEVIVSTPFEAVDENKARRELADTMDALENKTKNALASTWNPFGSKYERKLKEVSAVLSALEESDHGLYNTHTYITVRSADPEKLQTAVSALRSRLQDAHINAKRMNFNHDTGYRMTAPTVPKSAYQPVKMLGMGLASLFPWATQTLTEPSGIEVGEHGYTGEPMILDWFGMSTGYNFGIYGNIGSGKTTSGKRIAFRQKTKDPDMKLVMIDPLQEFAGLCEVFDGKHIIVGGETPINPMRIEPTPPERLHEIGKHQPFNDAVTQTMGFLGNYYHVEELSGFDQKKGTWRKAVKRAYKRAGITKDPTTHHHESPTLLDVIEVLKDMVNNTDQYVDEDINDVDEAVSNRRSTAIEIVNNDIEAFYDEYEQLTQTSNLSFDDVDTIYLDLQRYENDKKRGGLMMELLLKEMYEQAKITNDNMMMLIDEASYMLKNSANLESLKQAHRHSRHHNLAIGLLTQSISEFFAETSNTDGERVEKLTDSAEVIFRNQSRQIYHYLKEMNYDWGGEVGLSDAAVDYISDAATGETGKGWSDAVLTADKKGAYPLRVRMDDSLNPREFALLEYDAKNHGDDLYAFLEQYCEESEEVWDWGGAL